MLPGQSDNWNKCVNEGAINSASNLSKWAGAKSEPLPYYNSNYAAHYLAILSSSYIYNNGWLKG